MQTLISTDGRLSNLIGNSGWSILVQSVRAGALAVVMILLARYLGPTAFGVFAVAFSIVKILSVVAALGLDRVVVKRMVQGAGADVLRKTVGIRLVGGVVAYGLAIVAGAMVDRSISGVLKLVCMMGPILILQAANTCELAFQAESRMRLTAMAMTPPLVLSALVKILAMAMGASLVAFAWLELLEGVLRAVGLTATYLATHREGGREPTEAVGQSSFFLLREGFPLLLSALAVIAYMRSDLLMLGLLANADAVGIFSAAAQLSEVWSLLPMALMPAILPHLLKMRERDRAAFGRALSLLFGGFAIAAIGIALAMTLLAPWLVSLLFGVEYADATPVLRIHIWSVVFIYLGIVQSVWDLGENRLWWSFARTAGGAILNIALNLWLIPLYGPLGAAAATLSSYAASGVLLNVLSPHTRGILLLQLWALLVLPTLFNLRRHASSEGRAVT